MRLLIPVLILLPIIAISGAPAEVRTSQPIEFPADFAETTTTPAPKKSKADCVIVFNAFPRYSEYDLTAVHFLTFTTGLLLGCVMMSCCKKLDETITQEQKNQMMNMRSV
uniref:FXYD domain-containing ion transport regulator n=1 Tax=Panagrellus redivivus TaxID=6233 RepID=A0A7E4ZRL8_PANRE